MMRIKRWKSPKIKKWFMFIVDGKIISVNEDNAKIRKKIDRLFQLQGVEVKNASDEALIMFKAFTVIPSRIVRKMEQYHYEATQKKYRY